MPQITVPPSSPSPAESRGTSTLDIRFRDAAQRPRLRPQEERALASALRAARVCLWRALLKTTQTSAIEADLRMRFDLSADQPLPDPQEVASLDQDGHLAQAALARVLAHEPDPGIRRRCRHAAELVRRHRDTFVSANLGLVIMVARRYERGHLAFSDLVQEGNTGLLKAVDRFDPDRGFRFSTYAVWWIRHAIGRALSDKSREIRLPVHVVEQQQTVLRARSEFEGRHGRVPEPKELATEVKLPVRKIERLLAVNYARATTVARNDDRRRSLDVDDLASPSIAEPDLDQAVIASGLRAALGHLSEMEQDVIRRRFGLDGGSPMTLREVGELHDLSRERIRQLQERALSRLRRELETRGLA